MQPKETSLKSRIRREALAKRGALTEEERNKAGMILADRIIGHQWFYRSEVLLLFASYGSEISTKEIIEEGLRKGKRVYLPKVCGDNMDFYRIHTQEELIKGYHGIPEPPDGKEKYLYEEENAIETLLLMPGVAFDPYRNRIGYGKGFYDRYLSDKEALILRSIAVGYKCQLVEEIPAEPQDIRPYQVILI